MVGSGCRESENLTVQTSGSNRVEDGFTKFEILVKYLRGGGVRTGCIGFSVISLVNLLGAGI